MNDLEEEKKVLLAKIQENYDKIAVCEIAIHWDKKKLKIVNQQIDSMKETSVETLQDISKNLK